MSNSRKAGSRKAATFSTNSGGAQVELDAVNLEPGASLPWPQFIQSATHQDIQLRFVSEMTQVVAKYSDILKGVCCIALMAPHSEDSVSEFYADQIYAALQQNNANRDKDVLLIIVTRGGSIEPAFQISKLCKGYAKNRFAVLVPRRAKSAGTLIAIGADEIHIGPLGQLGPIDPQLRGLPALGVAPALERIASLAERYPASAEMFARYLRMTLTVEEIGYYERISQSAAQYAERLLSTKKDLTERKTAIANELVYALKDHGFVIDFDEAQKMLGTSWILNSTRELELSEALYKLFEVVNLWLQLLHNQRLLLIGDIIGHPMIFNNKKD